MLKELAAQNDALFKKTKAELLAKLVVLRDTHINPKMKMVKPNVGVVKFSDLADNWSAEHHLFSAQYSAVIARIERAESLTLLARIIESAVETKVVEVITGDKPYRINLQDDVVSKLEELL